MRRHEPPSQSPTFLASINTTGWKLFYVALNAAYLIAAMLGWDHGYDTHPHLRVAAILVNTYSLVYNSGCLARTFNSRTS